MGNVIWIWSYQGFDRDEGNHTRKCIDGTTTGSNKCVGYCRYDVHPGFLTAKLRKAHACVQKRCVYYLEKEKRELSAWQMQLQECARQLC